MNIPLPDLIKALLTLNFLRYFLAAMPAFLIFYVWKKKRWGGGKIQDKFPKRQDYYREIGYSVVTLAIFTLVGLVIIGTPLK